MAISHGHRFPVITGILLSVALLLGGCLAVDRELIVPATPASDLLAIQPRETTQGETLLATAAAWQVTIDPTSLSASVAPDLLSEHQGSSVTGTYLLDVSPFFRAEHLRIRDVTRIAPDRLRVHYTIEHPFAPASDPDAPPSATNRADLGFTGIVLFAIDAPVDAPVYFNGTAHPIRANTDAVANPDGYYAPAGLMDLSDMSANCFPFRRLVDDSVQVSRPGIARGGDTAAGNFGAASGWQRFNWGTDRRGWTGYGALHQGQTAQNTVDLALPVDGGPLSLPFVLIAKFLDPVQGTGAARIANRLPTADKDVERFLYRMPQGAWDLESVKVLGVEGRFNRQHPVACAVSLHVTDADARAISSSWPSAPDFNASHVAVAEPGMPSVSVSVPGCEVTPGPGVVQAGTALVRNNDSQWGGDAAIDSGLADDPILLEVKLAAVPASLTAEHYTGMVRLLDPADAALNEDVLDASLQPITGPRPDVATYQTFAVDVDVSGSGWVRSVSPEGVNACDGLTVDTEGNIYVLYTNFWPGIMSLTATSEVRWDRPNFCAGYANDTKLTSLSWSPGLPLLVSGTSGQYNLNFGGGSHPASALNVAALDPETGAYVWGKAVARPTNGYFQTPLNAHHVDNGYVAIGGNISNGTSWLSMPMSNKPSAFVLFLNEEHKVAGGQVYSGASAFIEGAECVRGANGRLYLGAILSGSYDFGGGMRLGSDDRVLLALTDDGAYLWDRVANSANAFGVSVSARAGGGCLIGVESSTEGSIACYSEDGDLLWQQGSYMQIRDLASTPDGGAIVIALHDNSTEDIDYGFGTLQSQNVDAVCVRTTSDGAPMWATLLQGPKDETPHEMAVTGDGHFVVLGRSDSPSLDVVPGLAECIVPSLRYYLIHMNADTGTW